MEKIKGKHTLPRHEETKRGVFVSTMNQDEGGKKTYFLEMRRQFGLRNDKSR